MTVQIVTVPCLTDNYAFLIHDAASGQTALVDVPDAPPVNAELAARGWKLGTVLITHHHADHVQGLDALSGRDGVRVVGHAEDAHRLPRLDRTVRAGDVFEVCGQPCHVIEAGGHTLGHIAYHMPQAGAVFTADSLMAFGCGRVFEGTMPQMYASLQRLAALDPETLVYSGHEYTQANGRFAAALEPGNRAVAARVVSVAQMRAAGAATVPSSLAEELRTNPYLRCDDPALAAAVGLSGADPVDVFAEIRRRKDRF